MNRFRLKQWHTLNDVEEVIEKFDGNVEEYFQNHLERIREDNRYRIVTSNRNEQGFFIELTEGKFHTVKCTAEML